MKLYDYYRSSCSYRVRIALNLKKLKYDTIPIHLLDNGGEQHSDEYKSINPQEIVPSLMTDDGVINQSMAIIEYLEELYPEPPLLPNNIYQRAEIRNLALIIACEIHPLNNLRVLQTLQNEFKLTNEQKIDWYHKWLKIGFCAFEEKLKKYQSSSNFCYGESVTLADIFLIPQVYNAQRFEFPMHNYPLIMSINNHCLSLPAFIEASP